MAGSVSMERRSFGAVMDGGLSLVCRDVVYLLGALGGMGMALFTGYILDATHSYSLLFAICASAYIVALGVVHLLSPRLAPARIG